jgi:hypothetical protein
MFMVTLRRDGLSVTAQRSDIGFADRLIDPQTLFRALSVNG